MVRKHKTENQKSVSGSSKELSGAQKRKRQEQENKRTQAMQETAAKYFKLAPPKPNNDQLQPSTSGEDYPSNSGEYYPSNSGKEDPSNSGEEDPSNSSEVEVEPSTSGKVDSSTSGQDEPLGNVLAATCTQEFTNDDRASTSEGAKDSGEADCENVIQDYGNGNTRQSADNASDTTNTGADMIFFDPSSWPLVLTEHLRSKLVHVQMTSEELEHENSAFVYWKRFNVGNKANGEPFTRSWVLYSLTTSSAFCLPCCLYSEQNLSPWSNYGSVGFTDFKHGIRGITRHEESVSHIKSMTTHQKYLKSLLDSTTLASKLNSAMQQNVSEWRKILRGILDAIFFLAQNNLAFQGHSRNIADPDCGNFLNLVKLLSKYYSPLAEHVSRLRKGSVSYLSPMIQNEFIYLCGQKIKSRLLADIKKRKYYTIMFDSTPDTSHMEQVSQVIRSVECSENGCTIKENFIDFISTTQKTGAGLTEVILKKLKDDGIDIKDCRGQSYDNGSNMAGCYSGVQARILKVNSSARFVPCAAHSLNLVGVNSAEKILEAKLILGVVQNLYTFFASSPVRWEQISDKLNVTLKSQSSTRWSSKAAAVSALWNNFGSILNVLNYMSTSTMFNAETTAAAESRLRDLMNFKFVFGLTVWNQLLTQINLCNLKLQAKDSDVSCAQKNLSVLTTWLEDFTTTGFAFCLSMATDLAEEHEISLDSGFTTRRGRGINPKYDYMEKVKSIKSLTNIERFKLEFFDSLVSQITEEMKKRFAEISDCVNDFNFLWGKELNESIDNIAKKIRVESLCNKYPNDLNSEAFWNEIQTLSFTVQAFADGKKPVDQLTPLDVLNLIYGNHLESAYSNCEIALRIFLTFGVSVASNERVFSKLKLIKNYVRSSMGQERLNGLAIISIERTIAESIDFDEVINDFCAVKCRKIKNV